MDCIVPQVYSASTCTTPPPLSKYLRIPQLPLQSQDGLYSTSSIQCKYLHPPCLSIPGFPSYLYNPGMECTVPPVYNASTCPPLSKYPRIPQLPLQSRDGLYSTSSIQCKYLHPPPLSKYPRIPQLPLQSRGGLYSTSSIQCKYIPDMKKVVTGRLIIRRVNT